jgi:hypothetical protein
MTVINTWHLAISNTVGPNQFMRMHGMLDFSFYCKTEINIQFYLFHCTIMLNLRSAQTNPAYWLLVCFTEHILGTKGVHTAVQFKNHWSKGTAITGSLLHFKCTTYVFFLQYYQKNKTQKVTKISALCVSINKQLSVLQDGPQTFLQWLYNKYNY